MFMIITLLHLTSKIPKTVYITGINKEVAKPFIDSFWSLHSMESYKILFFDDAKCIQEMQKDNLGRKLIPIFNNTYNDIKGDIFRMFFLYKYGGIYSDIDNNFVKSLDFLFSFNFSFFSIASKFKSVLNPIVIATESRNQFLFEVMKLTIHRWKNKKRSYWDLSICQTGKVCWEQLKCNGTFHKKKCGDFLYLLGQEDKSRSFASFMGYRIIDAHVRDPHTV